MAEQRVLLDQGGFCCSICLDLLEDPVTTACGHSYCMVCITKHWDKNEQRRVNSCPQCRQTFTARPVLMKNSILAECVEKLKKIGLQAAPPALCYAGPGDVACDVCTGRKQKALKSCLVCLASYCETHLQPYYESPAFMKHKLVKVSTQLQEKVCPHHDELLEVFCRTDQQCICNLCLVDEHKGHDTVSAAAEWTDKQSQLVNSQQEVRQRVQQRENELKELQEAMEDYNSSAQTALEGCEWIFTELIRSIEKRRSEMKELVRVKHKEAVSQAKGLMERLEQEIAELKRRDTELEQLSHTDDHIHFLQNCAFLSSVSVTSDLPRIRVHPPSFFTEVSQAMIKLENKLHRLFETDWPKLSKTKVTILMSEQTNPSEKSKSRKKTKPPKIRKSAKPQTRADFLKYSCRLSLDPNTTNIWLSMSERNRKVTCGPVQSYPDHPERFAYWSQVLCREGVSERGYWEVECSGRVCIAVSYKDISRTGTGDDSLFGGNNLSWSLDCSHNPFLFKHNNVVTIVTGLKSSRVGVYLDHRAGTLSFYSVSDTMTLLHRVHTTFTQPLYPGFWVGCYDSSAELYELK